MAEWYEQFPAGSAREVEDAAWHEQFPVVPLGSNERMIVTPEADNITQTITRDQAFLRDLDRADEDLKRRKDAEAIREHVENALPGEVMARQFLARNAAPVERAIGNVFPSTGLAERADEMNRYAELSEQELRRREEEYWRPGTESGQPETLGQRIGSAMPAIQRTARGAAQSIGSMLLAGKAGRVLGGAKAAAPAAIAAASIQEADQAITSGKDSGLEGAELAAYVASQGLIEAIPASVMQRMGLGGVESLVLQKTLRDGVRRGLVDVAKSTAQEIPEELVTEIGHALANEMSGVNPEALSGDQMQQTIADTILQTVIAGQAGGAMRGAQGYVEGQRRRQRYDAIRQMRQARDAAAASVPAPIADATAPSTPTPDPAAPAAEPVIGPRTPDVQTRFKQNIAEQRERELWSNPQTAVQFALTEPEVASALAEKKTYLPRDFEEADLPVVPDPALRRQWKGWVQEALALPEDVREAVLQEPSDGLGAEWSRVPDGVPLPGSPMVETIETPFGSLIRLRQQQAQPAVDDNGFTTFPEESGTLGIPRAEMPQIKTEQRGAFANFARARGVEFERTEVRPDSLKPSQAEYSPAKVEKARGYDGPERAIIVSSDGYVVDGHHQWQKNVEDRPSEPMPVVQLGATAEEAIALAREFPSSETDDATTSDSRSQAAGTGDAVPSTETPSAGPLGEDGRTLDAGSLDGRNDEPGESPVADTGVSQGEDQAPEARAEDEIVELPENQRPAIYRPTGKDHFGSAKVSIEEKDGGFAWTASAGGTDFGGAINTVRDQSFATPEAAKRMGLQWVIDHMQEQVDTGRLNAKQKSRANRIIKWAKDSKPIPEPIGNEAASEMSLDDYKARIREAYPDGELPNGMAATDENLERLWNGAREAAEVVARRESRAAASPPSVSDTARADELEPWQQTKDQYVGDATDPDVVAVRRVGHGKQVQKALEEGKPVPREVLEAYRKNNWAKKAIANLESTDELSEQPSDRRAELQAMTMKQLRPLVPRGKKGLNKAKSIEAILDAEAQSAAESGSSEQQPAERGTIGRVERGTTYTDWLKTPFAEDKELRTGWYEKQAELYSHLSQPDDQFSQMIKLPPLKRPTALRQMPVAVGHGKERVFSKGRGPKPGDQLGVQYYDEDMVLTVVARPTSKRMTLRRPDGFEFDWLTDKADIFWMEKRLTSKERDAYLAETESVSEEAPESPETPATTETVSGGEASQEATIDPFSERSPESQKRRRLINESQSEMRPFYQIDPESRVEDGLRQQVVDYVAGGERPARFQGDAKGKAYTGVNGTSRKMASIERRAKSLANKSGRVQAVVYVGGSDGVVNDAVIVEAPSFVSPPFSNLDTKSFNWEYTLDQMFPGLPLVVVDPPATADQPSRPTESVSPEEINEQEENQPEQRAVGDDRPPLSELGQAGTESTLATADGKSRKVQYVAVEASEVIPSHDARRAFTRNVEGDENERPYHDPKQGASSRQTVLDIAAMDPDKLPLLVSDTRSVVDGPPIATDTGVILGGNARSMGMQLAYHNGGESAARLKQATVDAAGKFGIDAASVEGMDQPIIVRVLDDPGKRGELSALLNESLAASKSQATVAVSQGKRVSEDTATRISAMLEPEALDDSPSIREILSNPRKANEIVQRLSRDGAWSDREIDLYVDPNTGVINADGKAAIEQLLVGKLISDPSVLGDASPGVRQKLVTAIGPLVRGMADKKHGPRLSTAINNAVQAYDTYKDDGRSIEAFFMQQGTLFESPGQGDYVAAGIVHALESMGPRKFKNAIDGVVRSLGIKTGGQTASLFGEMDETVDTIEEAVALEIRPPLPQPNSSLDRPSAVDELIAPELQERQSMGAARQRVASAADLVGDIGEVKKSKYASPNEEFEKRYQAAKQGIGRKTWVQKLAEKWNKLVKNTTRGSLPELPRTEQFGEARSALHAYQSAPQYAAFAAKTLLGKTVKPLDPDTFDLFTRAVILRDLGETEGVLPFGLDQESAAAELQRVESLVAQTPEVEAALDYRTMWLDSVREDYIDAHKELGIDMSDRFNRENYFRHQVLFHHQIMNQGDGNGSGGRAQTKLGRSWLQKREGSELDINANYFQAEWQVATQMLADTQRARALARVKRKYDVLPDLKARAKQDGSRWADHIPEDHQPYQLRPGRSLFRAHTIPEDAAEFLLENLAETLEIDADMIRPVMAMGARFEPIVVPDEVAQQMELINKERGDSLLGDIDQGLQNLTGKWKQWVLLSPRRFIKYNLRNISEVDKVVALNPQTLRHVPRAVKDLWDLYSKSDGVSSDVRDWLERGGASSLVRINELGDMKDLKEFATLVDDKQAGATTNFLREGVRQYWEKVGMATDFRESILRYSAYLEYLDQLRKNGGKPNNYGGSNRAEVDGIDDMKDKAMRLSNDLLGDYSDISVAGQWMRSRLVPFWSFQETNFRTYANGVRNLASNEQTAIRAGMAVAKRAGIGGLAKAPFLAMKVGRIALMYYGAKALLDIINHSFFPDEEEDLPEDVKRTPHIIFGRDSDGNVLYFSRLGTSLEFLDWFGLDTADSDIKDVLDGRRTVNEVARSMAMSPVNKLWNGLTPLIGVPADLATGISTYPRIEDAKTIRDRGEHIARSVGLENEYKSRTGKPTRGYVRSLRDAFVYTAEPGQAKYYGARDQKYRWSQRELGAGRGSFVSPRGEALRNFKMAVHYDDQTAADKYLAEYQALGGTKEGLQKSLEALHPMAGLSQANEAKFWNSRTDTERDEIADAERFMYDRLLTDEQRTDVKEARQSRIESMVGRIAVLDRLPSDPDERADYYAENEEIAQYIEANMGRPGFREAVEAAKRSESVMDYIIGDKQPPRWDAQGGESFTKHQADMERYQERVNAARAFMSFGRKGSLDSPD